MRQTFKKLAMQSVIGLLVFEALVGGQVFAQTPGLHDSISSTGDIYITGSVSGDGVITKLSASGSYAQSTVHTFTGGTDVESVIFLPNGDLVALKSYNKLYCYTYLSGFTTPCTWATASGYQITGPNVFIAGFNADAYGNIWLANMGGVSPMFNGTNIIKLTTAGTPVQSSYDATFGGSVLFDPLDVVIDRTNHIWFSSYIDSTASIFNTKVYCLTQAKEPCTGSGFDINGGVEIGGTATADIAVGPDNMIYTSTNSGESKITKINASNGEVLATVTTAAYVSGAWITVDGNNRVWISQYSEGSPTVGHLSCFTSNLTACPGISNPINFNGLAQPGAVFNDKDNNIWITAFNTSGSSRLYCFKSADGAACSTGGLFTNTDDAYGKYYLSVPLMSVSDFQFQLGDPTGMVLAASFSGYAGDANSTITATVDPTITFNVTSTCNLPNMNATTISGCAVTSTVSTNGLGGYVAYVTDSSGNAGALKRTDSLDTIAVSDGSILSTDSGEAGFGVTTSQADRTISQHSDSCAGTTTVGALSVSALTTGPQSYASSSTVTDGTGDGLSTLCVRAKPSATTPAGSYTTTLTLTAVASF